MNKRFEADVDGDDAETAHGPRRVPPAVNPREAGSLVVGDAAEAATVKRIGKRIREVRKDRGLAAKELARLAGVTPGMISQIEGGMSSPSIATLLRIAGALHVSVGDLFDQVPAVGRVMRVNDRVRLDYPGSGIHDSIISADPTGQIQVFWAELEPGASSGEEALEHGSAVEFVLVLKGRAAVDLGAETVELEAGDTVTFSGRAPHRYRNLSRGRTTLIWVTTPRSY